MAKLIICIFTKKNGMFYRFEQIKVKFYPFIDSQIYRAVFFKFQAKQSKLALKHL